MFKLNIKTTTLSMIFAVSSIMLFGCEQKSTYTPDHLAPKFQGLTPHPFIPSGWHCTQKLIENGEVVGEIVGFYNFYADTESANNSTNSINYTSISKANNEGIAFIYKSTGNLSYDHQELSINGNQKDFLLTEKTLETLDELPDDTKELVLQLFSSGDLNSEPIILQVTNKDTGYFSAENNDIKLTCQQMRILVFSLKTLLMKIIAWWQN